MGLTRESMCVMILPFLFGISDGQVHLEITPTEIKVGCTDTLLINCTFDKDTTTIYFIVNIFIKYKPFSSNQSSEDVASIFVHETHDQVHSNNENVTVSGQINTQSGAYLVAHWMTPTEHQAGDYKCEITGTDQVGHLIKISDDAQVSYSKTHAVDPDIKLKELEARLDSMNEQWNNLNTELLRRIGYLEDRLKQVESILFASNTTFQGHQYFLSRYSYRSIDLGMATCHHLGSYLLEIDNKEEYDAIVLSLSDGKVFDGVFISGSDADIEGHWSFQRTGVEMPFTAWGPSAPSGSDSENCALLWRSSGWKMVDDPCYDNSGKIHVICEKSLPTK